MAQKPTRNTLYYGDNLPILRGYIADESVDLVYLDPPFNSNRSYNVLFREESGEEAAAQITAFDDTWHWNEHTAATYHEMVTGGEADVAALLSALRQAIGTNQMMAYLVMMAARLVELHRVLKPTGSLYLHCDPTASHYLKVVMDAIFGVDKFRSEIVWKRTTTHSDAKRWSPVSDTLLFYTKTNVFTWNPQHASHGLEYVADKYRFDDQDGRGPYTLDNMTSPNPRPNMMYEWKGHTSPQNGWRYSRETMLKLDTEARIWYPNSKDKRPRLKRYLAEMPGRIVDNVWLDIFPINSQAQERLGYPTQKPVALLERIIQASSNPGDLVLDPFCGCGTTIAAAQKLERRWIGIDITHLSISLLKYRLKDAYGLVEKKDYDVYGEPVDVESARQLALDDRHQFQYWAGSLVQAKPQGGGKESKKGSDRGIDGIITFVDDHSGKGKQILVQVKSGKVKSGDVRDLRGTVEREGAAMGVFIALEPLTSEMRREAAAAGMYTSPLNGKTFPKLQLFTIEELMAGAEVKRPSEAVSRTTTFKKAGKVKAEEAEQLALGEE